MTTLVVLHRICLAVQLLCAVLFVVESVRFHLARRRNSAELKAAVDRLEKVFKS